LSVTRLLFVGQQRIPSPPL